MVKYLMEFDAGRLMQIAHFQLLLQQALDLKI